VSRFVFNDHAFHQLMHDPNGPVGRDLQRRAINVESAAKVNASGRPGPNVDTGRLRSSITWELVDQPESLVARVGTNVEYARWVEEGTDRAPAYPYLVPALPAARI
jgi:hypothetical protein